MTRYKQGYNEGVYSTLEQIEDNIGRSWEKVESLSDIEFCGYDLAMSWVGLWLDEIRERTGNELHED